MTHYEAPCLERKCINSYHLEDQPIICKRLAARLFDDGEEVLLEQLACPIEAIQRHLDTSREI